MKTYLTAAALIAAPVTALFAQAALPAKTYIMKAGASDQYEIQSSKLLLASTTNPSLKTFASEMVTDHMKSTADGKAAAASAHIAVLPPGLTTSAARRGPMDPARDALYVSQQKTAHQKALMLQQDYAANGTVASLKTAASNIVPVVQHHIAMLDAM